MVEKFSQYEYVKQVTPGVGPFLSQGYNLNNLHKGPQDKATYQISRPGPSSFTQEDFF